MYNCFLLLLKNLLQRHKQNKNIGNKIKVNPVFILLNTPQSYVKSYLFAMPPDLHAMLAAAVKDRTASWRCPNGHVYFIGNRQFFFI